MRKTGELDLLHRQKPQVIDALQRMLALSRRQKDIIEKATPEEIENFRRAKKETLDRFNLIAREMQSTVGRIEREGDTRDKQSLSTYLSGFKKETGPLLDEIVRIETADNENLGAIRDGIARDLKELMQSKEILKSVRSAYASGYAQNPVLFDKKQ